MWIPLEHLDRMSCIVSLGGNALEDAERYGDRPLRTVCPGTSYLVVLYDAATPCTPPLGESRRRCLGAGSGSSTRTAW